MNKFYSILSFSFIFLVFTLSFSSASIFGYDVDIGATTVTTLNVTGLNDLDDTNVPTPTDSYVLTFNSTSGKWEDRSAAAVGDTNETTRFDTLTGTDCGGTDKVVGIQNDGTVLCDTDETGGAAGNPFDQDLNTTSNVTFDNVSAGSGVIWTALGDIFALAHVNHSNATNFAFGQEADGHTHLNAPSGQTIGFHINDGTESMEMSETLLQVNLDANVTGTVWALGVNLSENNESITNTFSLYTLLSDLVNQVGNWSADKDNYVLGTELNNGTYVIDSTLNNGSYFNVATGETLVSNITCTGDDKVSAYDNVTGNFVCTADTDTDTFNTSQEMWDAVINGTPVLDSTLNNGSYFNPASGEPNWDANFTNHIIDCPSGNYTYGAFENGTRKCRDDLTGAAAETDPYWSANYSTFLTHATITYVDTQNTSQTNYINSNNQSITNTFSLYTLLSDLINQVGNWSADKDSYTLLTTLNNGTYVIDSTLNNGSYLNTAETDPQWLANYTNMQVDCPAGNYTYGEFPNGTKKCRDDVTGAGAETDPFWTANFTNTQVDCDAGNYSYGNFPNGTQKCRSDDSTAYDDSWINETIYNMTEVDDQDLIFNNSIVNWILDQYYTITQIDNMNTSNNNYIEDVNTSVTNTLGTYTLLTTLNNGSYFNVATGETLVSNITCSGDDKVSAYDNVTGNFVCTADTDTDTFNTSQEMWDAVMNGTPVIDSILNNGSYFNTGVGGDIHDQDLNTTDDVTFNNLTVTNNISALDLIVNGFFRTSANDFLWDMYDNGAGNLHLNVSSVTGINYFGIETAGAFFQMYANPGPANDYLMATISETQGADTDINFYEGGPGNNRGWFSGSVRIGGLKSSTCDNLTTDVDCITAGDGSGSDLVVAHDGWFGGKLFSSDWSNVSINGNQVVDDGTYRLLSNNTFTTNVNLTDSANITIGDTGGRYCLNWDCSSNIYNNGTHSIWN